MDDVMRRVWTAVAGGQDLPAVAVTRPGRYLPARLPVRELMLAVVGASTAAAAILDGSRTGRPPQGVVIDAEHVAVAARSERFTRTATPGGDLFAPLSRFWRTRDGWVRLHGNYPWHRDRALAVLGCSDDPATVERAIAGWDGHELEDALAAAGAVGYAVRTPQEWAAHPHGRLVRQWPLVRQRTTDTTGRGSRGLPPGRLAHGVRVLDLTRVIAGPVATRTLAAWGADVLRVDSPDLPELPAQLPDTLVGKRSTLLDLATPAGRAALDDLLDQAHVLVQGYRPGALARYGLGADELHERRPGLTVVNISAWGHAGPWSARRGFDSVVQCPTGVASVESVGPVPGALPAQALDHATGYLAAATAMLSLASSQGARHSDLSLAQTAHVLLSSGAVRRGPAPGPHPDEGDAPDDTDDQRALRSAGSYLTRLAGASALIDAVAPPGRVGTSAARWRRTTSYGTDPAEFRPVGDPGPAFSA